jgi:malate dehydrogenase (oxaloacetate-decarboxylating)
MAYIPGVSRIGQAIASDKSKAHSLTIKSNMVAVVTDGSAVVDLGNVGPEAALPVMEGKAMLFKEFGQVDAFPICLATQDTEIIIQTVKAIAPVFGGINLENISAPRCFEIEQRLAEELDIPVMHDDQHGTAVVVLAALLNALKVTGKKVNQIKVVVAGTGASGIACSKILIEAGVQHIIGVDRHGALYKGRQEGMNPAKAWYAENTNPEGRHGALLDVIEGADVFLGLAKPGILPVEGVRRMAPDPIVFLCAGHGDRAQRLP